MCRSKHNYSAESDGIVAWHPHASPPGPAVATPCDEGPQVATAGGATTTSEAKLTILIQSPRIRNQNTYTADISSMQNSAFHSTRPTTSQANNIWDRPQEHDAFRMDIHHSFKGAAPSVAIIQYTLTRRKNNPNPASQTQSVPQNNQHKANSEAQ